MRVARLDAPAKLTLTDRCSVLVSDCDGDGITGWNAGSFSQNVLNKAVREL
jgi:hypothetical protein